MRLKLHQSWAGQWPCRQFQGVISQEPFLLHKQKLYKFKNIFLLRKCDFKFKNILLLKITKPPVGYNPKINHKERNLFLSLIKRP